VRGAWSGAIQPELNGFIASWRRRRVPRRNRNPHRAFTPHDYCRSFAVKFLVWIGIAMVICWGVLWLGIKMAIGAVHLLLLLGVVLIGWGLLHTGGTAKT
jgi:hypothetical protein